jgi:hypothetical protein
VPSDQPVVESIYAEVRYLSQLAERTQHWLLVCHTQVLEVDADAIPAVTLRILLSRGLIAERTTKSNKKAWRTTEAGRLLIETEEPRLLAQRSERGYTNLSSRAMPGAGQAVSDSEQARMTSHAHARRLKEDKDSLLAARREQQHLLERLELLDTIASGTAIRNARRQLQEIDKMLKGPQRQSDKAAA